MLVAVLIVARPPVRPSPPAERPIVMVQLQQPPVPEPEVVPEPRERTRPEKRQPPPDPEDPPPQVAEAPVPAPLPPTPIIAQPDRPGTTPPDQPSVPDANELRRQALERVRRETAPLQPGRQQRANTPLTHAPAPALPGRAGWLNPYVGPVTPSKDVWRDPAGDVRGRIVLASGQVICTRQVAPTVQQMMKPWTYAGVTHSWLCGRERAEGPDLGDPRVRAPLRPGYRDEDDA